MDVEQVREFVKTQKGLSNTLGMEFYSTEDPDSCVARMKVGELNRQPFGFLSGGASLALAENVAGVGSMALCPGQIAMGINVSGNHVQAVVEGDTVTATARIVHRGSVLHTWQVDILNEAGDLISTVQVTNYMLTPKK
ncbi:MAG: PaaI family thioesterase [Prevotella sp.]|nr:PaaI family thioesterase [Prevotella sp.]